MKQWSSKASAYQKLELSLLFKPDALSLQLPIPLEEGMASIFVFDL